jgi:non-ribosomal peptide synthetase component F/acyl carrier protein
VTFTSGTTARPKGVAVPHRAVVRLVRGANYAALGAEEVFFHLAPAAFDASTFEIWGALCNGARLALLPAGKASLAELGGALERHGVTTLWLTAGLFHQLVEEDVAALAPVRQLLTGGEQVSADHVRRALAARQDRVVVNGYGPTENTTFTCCHAVTGGELGAGDGMPLGRPIANSRAYLLDALLRPVGLGVVGELCAAGVGLARGYLGRPELTAAVFVPDPYGGPGERLYKTGDLVRQQPATGLYEFLGRRDTQLKVRGHRVEPGEIEAALSTHPGVRQAIVLGWPHGTPRASGHALAAAVEPRLVAYWVAAATAGEGLTAAVGGGSAPAAAELRSFLRRRLPEAMVPDRYVQLARLPLTANGKVDRQALPDPEEASEELAAAGAGPRGSAAELATPRSPMEELIAGLWAELLGRERIGRDESFFDLGGHSLLATRMVSRLRAVLGIELPLRQLFEAPTVAGLARRIEEATAGGPVSGPPPLVPRPRTGPLPLAFAQRRLWYVDQLDPGTLALNVPAAWRLAGPLDAATLAAVVTEVVRRHEALRTVFPVDGGEPRQLVLPPPAPGALPCADLTRLPAARRPAEAAALAARAGRRRFDLARGPLLRPLLLRLAADDHLLLFTLHHSVVDGWSLALLGRELAAIYGAYRSGHLKAFAAPPVQYADYTLWQREWLDAAALDRLVQRWRSYFGARGLPPLRLPADRQADGGAESAGRERRRSLDPALLGRARSLGRDAGATLFMVLLTAFDALLYRLGGGDRVVVGTPVAGRDRVELEAVVGCLVNTVVLPVDCDGDPTFGELLTRVRETALTAYALQELPFENLVEALRPKRERGATPLFRVMFALLTKTSRDQPEAAGVRFTLQLAGSNPAAQFDLTLYMVEGPGELVASMEYRTALFEAATVERLLAAYEELLAAGITAPATPLSRLPIPADLAWRDDPSSIDPTPDLHTVRSGRLARLAARRSGLRDDQRAELDRLQQGEAASAFAHANGGALVEITPPDSSKPARPPLFCIHGASGDVQCYLPLGRRLGPRQPCYGLQAAGLLPCEAPLATIEEMAARYRAAIQQAQPHGPYLLAGWSFGGLAAFEVARQLAAAGEEIALLAILDTPAGLHGESAAGAPAAADDVPVDAAAAEQGDLAALLLDLAGYAAKFWGRDLALHAADLAGRDPDLQLKQFVARARAAGLVPHAGDVSQLRRLVAVLRSNLAAYRRYRLRPFAAATATLVVAEQGPLAELAADATLGWDRWTAVRRLATPGDHVTLLAEPQVETLAKLLGEAIGRLPRAAR